MTTDDELLGIVAEVFRDLGSDSHGFAIEQEIARRAYALGRRDGAREAKRVIGLAAIPLEALRLTEAEKPYAEHSPALKQSIVEATDAMRAFLDDAKPEEES